MSREKGFVKLYNDTKRLCEKIDHLHQYRQMVFKFQLDGNYSTLVLYSPKLGNTNVLALQRKELEQIALPVLRSDRVQKAIAEEYKEQLKEELEAEQDSYRELFIRIEEPINFEDDNEKDHG